MVLHILIFHRKYKSIRNITVALYFAFHMTAKKVSSLWLIINLSFCTTALSSKKKKEWKREWHVFLRYLLGWLVLVMRIQNELLQFICYRP